MAVTGDLLENGGAESGNSDWQAWGYFESVATIGSKGPHGGSKFFYGGDNNEHSELYQDIDVSEDAEKIDHPPSDPWVGENPVKATLSGYLNSYAGYEWPVLCMEFLDSSRAIKSVHETSRGTTRSTWTRGERANVEVPSGTRTIRVKMRSYRRSGADNDGYFDDLSLKLYIPTDLRNGTWTANKIQNPGAEEGLAHWNFPTFKSVESPFSQSDSFTNKKSKRGNHFWTPASEYIHAGACQVVDVSEYAEAIDGDEGLKASLTGYLSSRYDEADKARFRMLYLDSAGDELGSASIGYAGENEWQKNELKESLPEGTRAIQVIMETKEVYGYGAILDGSFDDLRLILHTEDTINTSGQYLKDTGLQHAAPDKGTNGKVDVPTGESTRFTVEAEVPSQPETPVG
jgi:hypothetical protein